MLPAKRLPAHQPKNADGHGSPAIIDNFLLRPGTKHRMSHFNEYRSSTSPEGDRNLGDEWLDWDGKDNRPVREGKRLYIAIAAGVTALLDVSLCTFVYLVTPRLALWHPSLPWAAWIVVELVIVATLLWFAAFALTAGLQKKIVASPLKLGPIFGLTFAGVFRIADFLGISRDRVGHSFVMVSNSLSRAFKPRDRQEKVLLLLPRCLAKEQLKEINRLKDLYPISIHTVSGGELARKKVKELRPTAIIGVACERDLVSGIRDVGAQFSVIGIPNQRPEGPCKNTLIDMAELIKTIEFFVGPPTIRAS